MIKRLMVAAFVAAAATGTQAATVTGISNFSNVGGMLTFNFDVNNGTGDKTGTTIEFSGGGISFDATGNGTDNIIQDVVPGHGGLGSFANSSGTDNLENGEWITLTFDKMVNILGFTFNGTLASNGHTDASDGLVNVQTSAGFNADASASAFDGVGSEGTNQGMLCPNQTADFCGVTWIKFTAQSDFGGYIESIKFSVVPLPATPLLLLSGLGGLALLRRKKKA